MASPIDLLLGLQQMQMNQENLKMRQAEAAMKQQEWQRELDRQARIKEATMSPRYSEQQQYQGLLDNYLQSMNEGPQPFGSEPIQPTAPISLEGMLQAAAERSMLAGDYEAALKMGQGYDQLANAGKKYGPSSLTEALGTHEGAFLSRYYPGAQFDPEELKVALIERSKILADPVKKQQYYDELQTYIKTLSNQGMSNLVYDQNSQQWMGFDQRTQSMIPVPGMNGRGSSVTMGEQTEGERTTLTFARDLLDLNQQAMETWRPQLTGPLQGTFNTVKSIMFDNPDFEAYRNAANQRIILSYQLSGKQMAEKEQQNIIGAFLPSVFQSDSNLMAREWALQRFTNANIYNRLKSMEGKVTLTLEDKALMEQAKQNMAKSKTNIFNMISKDKNGDYYLSSADKISLEKAFKEEAKLYPGNDAKPRGKIIDGKVVFE
jgi:hypothetical protein